MVEHLKDLENEGKGKNSDNIKGAICKIWPPFWIQTQNKQVAAYCCQLFQSN